ncbi:hypothetical protein FEI13_07980 [Halomonas urmiana]|uniref:Uncharacterized protein n=1 Tax=Halomonas urmiana TaxID=490901 RepID=A0A5R8MI03_9GAMM|nr:hypothetical protein [Halomonas urmiana]TLF51601.1 hypothetical protein FEI13_07980 [Halomonas urmiana]
MPRHLPPEVPTPIDFRATSLRALLYIILIGLLMQGVMIEALGLEGQRFSERGFVEPAQSLLLAGSTGLALYVRLTSPRLTHVSLLLLALPLASLIREQDAWLDAWVFDGAWQTLVALLVLPVLFVVIRSRHAFAREFERYANSFSFGLFAAGFLTTYVYSRLFGRSEMWQAILGEAYLRTFKDAAEEVTELFGYTLLFFAMIELVLLVRRWRRLSAD